MIREHRNVMRQSCIESTPGGHRKCRKVASSCPQHSRSGRGGRSPVPAHSTQDQGRTRRDIALGLGLGLGLVYLSRDMARAVGVHNCEHTLQPILAEGWLPHMAPQGMLRLSSVATGMLPRCATGYPLRGGVGQNSRSSMGIAWVQP